MRELNLRRLETRSALVEDLLKRGNWDLFFVTLSEFHCIGHDFWHLHDATHPSHNANMIGALGNPIEDVYRAADVAIGRILDCVDEETTVMLFAGPGMGPNYTASHMLDQVLRRLNLNPIWSTASTAGALRSYWRERLPETVRNRLKPLLKGMESAMLSAEYRYGDCFTVNQQAMHGAIRINLVGREPHGKINPGADFDRFCEDLTSSLLDLRNLDTDAPIVRQVLRADKVFYGPHLDQLPDILVIWNQETPITSIGSRRIGELTMDNPDLRSGEHFDRSLFVVRGPGIACGKNQDVVSVTDFAPTVAHILGTLLPGTDGTPIQAFSSRDAASD